MKSEIKKVWHKPEVREIRAGSAEGSNMTGNDGQGQGQGRAGS